ncbi:NAD(P)H-dependent oxidoreductase subunit E [Erysipelotrichaceae bacterium OttesenSCG-928-M19]|nr:NAD(P)H-dependent oxidoreductase subunit E [Erysipelotrichaceae bacterium OttesenSCG-928-M19]
MACNCNETGDNKAIFAELDEFIAANNCTDESSLINVLHRAQHLFGYLPRNVQIHVAEKLNIPVAKVYGVVSFYSFFTDTPRGENIVQVCLGTGCFVKGADKVMESFEKELNIKAGETTENMEFTLSGVRCVGACALAPVVLINDKVFTHVDPSNVKQILEDYLIQKVV